MAPESIVGITIQARDAGSDARLAEVLLAALRRGQ